jgi:hypothetical protein
MEKEEQMEITNQMLEKRVEMITEYLVDLGLLEGEELESEFPSMRTPHLILQYGSPTYGNAWRIFATGGTKYRSAHYDPLHLTLGYIGWTRKEAWQTLTGIYTTLSALDWQKKQKAFKLEESNVGF